MSDLYHIPNDDGKTYRLKKFVEYQHEAPATDYRFVAEYCLRHNSSRNEIVNMAFILAVTYSEITTVFVSELLRTKTHTEIWELKEFLNFGSAGKYKKYNDEYVTIMENWDVLTGKAYYDFITRLNSDNPIVTYRNVYAALKNLSGIGRFTIDQFLLMIVYMKGKLCLNIQEPTMIDWKHCANETSGIFNIFYEDEKANEFDKTGKITKQDRAYLSTKLKIIQKKIQQEYPNEQVEITDFIDKICSFRNLFKGTRYGGFHHDRELEVLRKYEKDLPEYKYLWNECYEIRAAIFPHRFLGELNGWGGIRKERKKLWITAGKTGVENE